MGVRRTATVWLSGSLGVPDDEGDGVQRSDRWRRRAVVVVAALALSTAVAACGGDDSGASSTSTTRAPLVAVALGDSFTAGAGAPPYDAGSGKCTQSPEAWVRQLADDSPDLASLDHRACGGAKTEHLTGPWTDRSLPAQIPTTADRKITLVLLMIGGNDVGFGGIVGTCVLFTCPSPTDAAFVAKLADLGSTLTTKVYPALARAYPNARIVHVGYPQLTPAPGQPVVGCGWLSADDQAAAAATVDALDGAIEAAAKDADVTYVDTTHALAGHELCSADRWVRNIGEESQVHPTADGYTAIEHVVAKALHLQLVP
jgi:lysophospholipase L1-like esterase